MKKPLATLLCLLLVLSLPFSAALAEDSASARPTGALEAIEARGALRVGTTGDYNPMSFLDPETNAYVGFDAALADINGDGKVDSNDAVAILRKLAGY